MIAANSAPEPAAAGETPIDAPTAPCIDAAESVFARAIRARDDRAGRPVMRISKAPTRIRPTTKLKGWFRCHPRIFGPIFVFNPKDEAGFDGEPVFVMPEIADELRDEGTAFQNAIREYVGHLVFTRGGALSLVLVPLPDPATGRHHEATEQKLVALNEAVKVWKRLDWNKDTRQFDDLTTLDYHADPEWPEDISEVAILRRSFGERNVIRDVNDPLIRRFRGQA
jgi:hypothetical protein